MIESTRTGPLPPSSAAATSRAETPSAAPPASNSPQPAGHWSTLWLTERDVAVFTGLAALVLVLLVARWVQLSAWGAREVEIERLAPIEHIYRFDFNEATWVEFAHLEGIGESLALAIVEDRERNGPFTRIEDLDRVKGIGPKSIERIRPYIRVGDAD